MSENKDETANIPNVHIAIYKWKEDAPLALIEEAIESLTGITDDVESLNLITWGRNRSKYSEGFSHAILILGEDSASIDAYRAHPLHGPVAVLLDRWEDVGVGVDFGKRK